MWPVELFDPTCRYLKNGPKMRTYCISNRSRSREDGNALWVSGVRGQDVAVTLTNTASNPGMENGISERTANPSFIKTHTSEVSESKEQQ